MSIAQKVLANPGKYSISQLQDAVEDGILPAYIAVPIIQEKVQAQKQAQSAQAMQQGPVQPPVAQQVMAEARGLESLPTNLPTRMAAGGIIAFEDGGEVPRYQSRGLVDSEELDRKRAFAGLGAIPIATAYGLPIATILAEMATQPIYNPNTTVGQALGRMAMGTGAMTAVPAVGTGATIKAGADMARMTPEQRRGFYSNPMIGGMSPDSALAGAIMNAGQGPDQTGGGSSYGRQMGNIASYLGKTLVSAPGDEMSPKGYGITRLLSGFSDTKPAAATAAQPTDLGPVPGSKPNEVLGSAPTGARPSTGTGLGGESALGRTPGQGLQASGFTAPPKGMSMVDVVNRQLYGNEYEPGLVSRTETRNRELFKELEKNKLEGKAFEGLESSLRKEAEQAGMEKSDAKNMAIFKAGLAMMAGTSRHALENIGKGAMTGAEDYQLAVKDLKKAEKERQRQFAYIEQARRAEDQDNLKRRDSLLMKANESAQKMDEFGVNAIVNATGKDRDQATEIWKTQYGGEKAVQVAQIGAGATLGAAALRQREGINPYQMARLRQEAEKQIDTNAIRAQVQQQMKLSKMPKAGADPTFEREFQKAYNAAIEERVNRNLGYGFAGVGGGGTGFKVPQGYRLLGPEE